MTERDTSPSQKEWDAANYHRVSDPHVVWGTKVLDRLPLRGDEMVLDAGCGTGRLTALLLERLPRGKVLAVDRSRNMLDQAAEFLRPRFGDQIDLVEADLIRLVPEQSVDAIFSTATFHWILDHEALFRTLHDALRPGGRLVAQCGGGPNLQRLRDRIDVLAEEEPYRSAFADWEKPVLYAGPEQTAARLAAAGFTGVRAWLESAPTVMPSADAYREFLRTVICHPWLNRLGDDEQAKERFLDVLTEAAADDDPPFLLDYWRLNMVATSPSEPW